MASTASPLPYVGGKRVLVPLLASLVGGRGTYIDPFLGGGVLPLNLGRSTRLRLSDADRQLIQFWRALRDDPEVFVAAVAERVPPDEEQWTLAHDRRRHDPVAWYVAHAWSYAAAGASWSPVASRQRGLTPLLADRLRWAASRLAGETLADHDWREALEVIDEPGDTALYMDPPYLDACRVTGGDAGRANGYAVELRALHEHEELLGQVCAIAEQGVRVVVSHYSHPLYDDALADWTRVEVPTTVRVGARKDRRCAPRREVVWCSDPPVHQEHLFA